MSNTFPHIDTSIYKKYFSTSTSLLPSSALNNFKIDNLHIHITFDAKNCEATWVKTYTLTKIANNHKDNDQWWEVTGCPAGHFIRAYNEHTKKGYADEGFLDRSKNILYRINLGEIFEIDAKVSLVVSFKTRRHEVEDKLILMEDGIYFKKYLFRYDIGYSNQIEKIIVEVETINGVIRGAWPKALSNIESKNTKVIYTKNEGLRPKEIFNPLIQIEYGNRTISKMNDAKWAILTGLITSIISGLIVFYFSTYIAT